MNAYSSEYPLTRFLLVYVNRKPGSKLDPLRAEFVRYLFSVGGQKDVLKDGYLPITPQIAEADMANAGVEPRPKATEASSKSE